MRLAGLRLSAKTNVDEVVRALDAWGDAVKAEAIPRAINTIATRVRRDALRKIAEDYGIAQGRMARYMELRLTYRADAPASIVAKGKGFPLALFRPRKHPKGIVVTLKGRDVLIPHAFLLRLGGGDVNVFARGSYSAAPGGRFVPTGERSGRFKFGRKRFPISVLRTFGPPEALRNRDVLEALAKRVEEDSAKELAREIRFAARQRGGR